MDERALTERLIHYDTSTPDGVRSAAGFVKGWLESRELDVQDAAHNGLPVIMADVGGASGPCLILHGHIDVVPGRAEQFEPNVVGDRLFGRGAYDMKGGLAAMMCAVVDASAQDRVRVRFLCTPDEESGEIEDRSTDALVRNGYTGDFAITGEPTDLRIGVQAKGVLALRLDICGKAAHGSTPWLGDNAILKATETFKAICELPFSRVSTELFDRPSINLGLINGGDALNKVPDTCTMDIDVRYLPGQDPADVLAQVAQLPDVKVRRTFQRPPAIVSPRDEYVLALGDAVERTVAGEALSVGRDGASEAVAFLEAGIPTVEFGPEGNGHHGPDEWVSISSLRCYRRVLGDFVAGLGELAERGAPDRARLEGGLA
jgi:succinyl-diaminopimelate desuccinylase